MAKDLITIMVPNWSKFNARSDRANYTWFRLQNDFLHDQAIFPLSDSQVVLWLLLLCEVSKKNSGELNLRLSYLAALRHKRPNEILKDLEVLNQSGIITLSVGGEEPSLRHQEVSSLPATDRQTDRHNRQTDISATALPPLARIWNENCGNLPKVERCGSTRKRQVDARWGESSEEGYWVKVISKIRDSKFCNGDNDRKWIADFDFLLKPDTQHRALEGKYDNRQGGAPPPRKKELWELEVEEQIAQYEAIRRADNDVA